MNLQKLPKFGHTGKALKQTERSVHTLISYVGVNLRSQKGDLK